MRTREEIEIKIYQMKQGEKKAQTAGDAQYYLGVINALNWVLMSLEGKPGN